MSGEVTVRFSGHLIFDGFLDLEDADDFAAYVVDRYGLGAVVSTKQDDQLEPFPFQLNPPVVYVKRREQWDKAEERAIEASVRAFGGLESAVSPREELERW